MSRGVVAVLAWPAGIILAIVCAIALAPHCGESPCALAPVPTWALVLQLALAFGPGIVATLWWRRGRRGRPE
jgi:hypothetical protein